MKHKNMYEYWDSLTLEERKEFLLSIYILPELAYADFHELPSNIRTVLHSYYNYKITK